MIKKVKGMNTEFQDYASKFESEINRGTSTLSILSIINQSGKAGVHGYQISKNLLEQTQEMLIIEEGTLYPILRKLEGDRIIKSERENEGRRRKYYSLTEYGKKIYNYLSGFYSKLTEAIAPLFDVSVQLKQHKYFFCPACANKIDLQNVAAKYCDVCGHYIENELDERGLKNE
ncbi:MAG: helix-turn-helix transcriptional regulator [Candidatus Lokiarchaeota archaeon]|nr:helix-turn-helix transcriptional regulator [Candidatus Lokiarchaeota archaeon]